MSSEIKIVIPNNNVQERVFTIQTIFNEFLGIYPEIKLSDIATDYSICFNQKILKIEDHFWMNYPKPLSYLHLENFPKVSFASNSFIVENDIPVLYGRENVLVSEDNITCEIDIFASSFFMLSRWEEWVNDERDQHSRFPGRKSIAFKNNFLQRPVVNEYVEMLWNMLVFLGWKNRKDRKFDLVLSHDVDILTSSVSIKNVLGDIFLRRKLKLAINKALNLFRDPVDTYGFLMDISEKVGVKSRFYFMATDFRTDINCSEGYLDNKRFKSLIKEIKGRNHVVGFHPGYFTYDSNRQWKKEKKALESKTDLCIEEGRQHFLMLKIPNTFRIWEKAGMKMDSTLGYPDKEGFRCGTGDCFHIFDFVARKELRLLESPLVLMEGTLKDYQALSLKEAEKRIIYYLNIGKKYKMRTTILFHNSSFDNISWKGWKKLYEKVITDAN